MTEKPGSPLEDLTRRKQQILRAVVIEYVNSAEPVGSEIVARRYRLGVGPATVRNEMAEMSERGYLEQPHTSAGRIPSDTGYRYYVDRLAKPEVKPEKARRVKSLSRLQAELSELLRETCRCLARLTQYVSAAVTVGERSLYVRQVSLTSIAPERALLILVLSSGAIENRIVSASPDVTMRELHAAAGLLNEAAEGKTLYQLSRTSSLDTSHLTPPAARLAQAAWQELRSVARASTAGRAIAEGTAVLLAHPEFQKDYNLLAGLVQIMDNPRVLAEAIERASEAGPNAEQQRRVSVTIGRENPIEAFRKMAIVAAKFYAGEEEAGTIAVIGPTRMRYTETIPLVETAASAITDALTKLMR
ncbi:MAG: heat-inducible transcription repressor HrcA [Fimbriimonadales bacterium]|nr:MAG: heat-inducible transcription repressor HrcA [Fimbriimonadales bacterium]